jgi:hypothetical protein
MRNQQFLEPLENASIAAATLMLVNVSADLAFLLAKR